MRRHESGERLTFANAPHRHDDGGSSIRPGDPGDETILVSVLRPNLAPHCPRFVRVAKVELETTPCEARVPEALEEPGLAPSTGMARVEKVVPGLRRVDVDEPL